MQFQNVLHHDSYISVIKVPIQKLSRTVPDRTGTCPLSTSRKFQWQNVPSQNRPWCRLGPCQQYSNYKKFCRIKPSIPKRSPSRNVLHPETSSIPKRPQFRNVSDRIRLRYESLETKSPTKRKFPLRIDLSHYTVHMYNVHGLYSLQLDVLHYTIVVSASKK